MAVEKKWLAVTATPLTTDGTRLGLVTVADTTGFKVKGYAYLATTGPSPSPMTLQVQIQRVISSTQMIVGPPGTTPAPNNFIDVSAFTVLSGAVIAFPEQDKNKIKADDVDQATYEADPVVARRVIPVSPDGNLIGPNNPLSVNVISSGSGSGLVPANYDDVKIIKNSNGDPTQYQFYLAGMSVGNINVFYDTFGASEYKKA